MKFKENVKRKVEDSMKNYLEKTLLPHCYKVACRFGFDCDLEQYSKMVLDSMKGDDLPIVEECPTAFDSMEVA